MTRELAGGRRRLLVVMYALGDSGGDRWIYRLEAEWAARDWEVSHFVFVRNFGQDTAGPPPEVDLVVALAPGRRVDVGLLRIVRRMYRVARQHDCVLIEPVGSSVLVAYIVARLARKPVVVYSQGVLDDSLAVFERRTWLRRLTRWMVLRADAGLGVSEMSAGALSEHGIAADRVATVRPGVDIDALRTRAVPLTESVWPDDAEVRLVGCGVLSVHKGFDRIIRAVAELRSRGSNVAAVLIGAEGDAYDDLVVQVHELGLEAAVRFVTQGVDPMPYFAAADLFVHGARSDAQPLVLVEALAVGTPVISYESRTGGPQDVLAHGRFGDLIADDDVAFVDAIERHLADPDRLRAMALGAEEYLRQQYSISESARRSAAMFAAVIGD